MKKLTSETKIILLFSFTGVLLILTVLCTAIDEQKFHESEFSKKVERIYSFRNVDCVYFTDGTSKCFSMYSVIDKNDTFTGVRLFRFISVGDSVVKFQNEAMIRVVKQ